MASRWQLLDHVLRGEATRGDQLVTGELSVGARQLAPVLVALGGLYGLCMGSFGIIRAYSTEGMRDGAVTDAWLQVAATTVKVPLLFLATLVVTLPSLYVFNALVGSSLKARSVLRLLIAMLGVTLAVLASLGPIVAFFGVSTTSYSFMILLNVACFGVAGVLGLAFLLRTLHRLALAQDAQDMQRRLDASRKANAEHESMADEVVETEAADTETEDKDEPDASSAPELRAVKAAAKRGTNVGRESPLQLIGERTDGRAKAVFRIWVVVFGLVGAQMSWVLRPFVGSPDLPFALFRERESNFFESVAGAIARLLGA